MWGQVGVSLRKENLVARMVDEVQVKDPCISMPSGSPISFPLFSVDPDPHCMRHEMVTEGKVWITRKYKGKVRYLLSTFGRSKKSDWDHSVLSCAPNCGTFSERYAQSCICWPYKRKEIRDTGQHAGLFRECGKVNRGNA